MAVALGAASGATLRDDVAAVERRAGAALRACGLRGLARPVVVTCADASYASALPLWSAHQARLGWTERAVLALDDAALAAARATDGLCALPFFVPGAAGKRAGAIPALTGLGKFWASDALLRRGVPHVLSEMDVFHFGDADDALKAVGWRGGRRFCVL